MLPLEYEIERLKDIYIEMFGLVRDQIRLTKEALLKNDVEIAGEVMRKESRINSYELTIDRECEEFLALHSPVAADLRLIIAILKMSANLERIGDHAYRISSYVYDEQIKLEDEIIQLISLEVIFEDLDKMFGYVKDGFENSHTELVKKVFKKDKIIDKINTKLPKLMQEYLKESKNNIANAFLVSKVVGKLERTGDLITNVAEEILFYYESKIVKHKKKNKRIKKRFSLKSLIKE